MHTHTHIHTHIHRTEQQKNWLPGRLKLILFFSERTTRIHTNCCNNAKCRIHESPLCAGGHWGGGQCHSKLVMHKTGPPAWLARVSICMLTRTEPHSCQLGSGVVCQRFRDRKRLICQPLSMWNVYCRYMKQISPHKLFPDTQIHPQPGTHSQLCLRPNFNPYNFANLCNSKISSNTCWNTPNSNLIRINFDFPPFYWKIKIFHNQTWIFPKLRNFRP